MHFGGVGGGRIGRAVLHRLKSFGLHLHYTDPHRLGASVEKELGLTYHPDAQSLVKAVDIVNLQMPLYPSTEHFFDDKMFAHMKRGSYLVNTARGKLVERDAVVRALQSGHLAGYAVDVWYPQPAPQDHPWRTMPYNGMTPHISGTSLSAQAPYAPPPLQILHTFFDPPPILHNTLLSNAT